MNRLTRLALSVCAGAGVVGLMVALATVGPQIGLAGEVALTVGILTVVGTAGGTLTYETIADSDRPQEPAFASTAANYVFYGLFWAAFAAVLTFVGGPSGSELAAIEWLAPAVGLAFVSFVVVQAVRGGLNPAFSPKHILKQYRDGKRTTTEE